MMTPPGSLPGMNSFASAPTTNPQSGTTEYASCPPLHPSKLRRNRRDDKPNRYFLGRLTLAATIIAAWLIEPRARAERGFAARSSSRGVRPGSEARSPQLARLARENAALKRELARLQVYRAMAYRDPLTGLWNRRYFEERLNEELSRSQRAGSAGGSR